MDIRIRRDTERADTLVFEARIAADGQEDISAVTARIVTLASEHLTKHFLKQHGEPILSELGKLDFAGRLSNSLLESLLSRLLDRKLAEIVEERTLQVVRDHYYEVTRRMNEIEDNLAQLDKSIEPQ